MESKPNRIARAAALAAAACVAYADGGPKTFRDDTQVCASARTIDGVRAEARSLVRIAEAEPSFQQ